MPSPFSGMNPYLENPAHWPSIHHRLIVAIANNLAPKLNPNYFVAIEVRRYELETIKQGYLEVKDIGSGEVVTTLEILSPINKKSGEGRDKYEKKRLKVLGSFTNLVEIDLLRKGRPIVILNNGFKTDYRILVSRSKARPKADLYAFNIPDKIPTFPLPLRDGDREPIIDLKAILDRIYDEGFYSRIIDYHQKPIPSLSKTDAVWADNLLRQNGLR